VKILDFGLAKAYDGDGSSSDVSLAHSPTMARPMTATGVILGTAAYMSPEQARGKPVDKRSDIWSFGVVLFEMLTGERLFTGETVSDVLAAVLTRDVELSRLMPGTPVALRDLLRRCLERKPKDRLHDIADARIVLDDLIARPHETPLADQHQPVAPVLPRRRVLRTMAWVAAGVAIGALLTGLLARTWFASKPPALPSIRWITYSGNSHAAGMSRDGRFVVFSSTRGGISRIWLKQLATGEEIALTSGNDTGPRISPDASTILFGRLSRSSIDVYRVPLVGGEPRRLVRDVVSFDWSPDGKRIAVIRAVGNKSQLVTVPADGGAETLLHEHASFFRSLSWSPDGRNIVVSSNSLINAIAVLKITVVEAASGKARDLYRAPSGSVITVVRWDGNDAVVFAWSATQAAHAQVLLKRMRLGDTTPESVFSFMTMPQRIEIVGPGMLLYDSTIAPQNLFEIDASGDVGKPVTGGPTSDRQPAFSADGAQIVFTSDRSGSLDLWSLDLSTAAVRRLTFDSADDWDPHWSPDGKHLLWSSNRGGNFEIWMAEADGSGPRQISHDGVDAENPTMSRGGSWIVYTSSNPAAPGIWKIHPDGSGATRLLTGNFFLPEVSANGAWFAATETSPGRNVMRIVDLETGKRITEVETSLTLAGGRARWMPDSRTLVYLDDDGNGRPALFKQTIIPGTDTKSTRTRVATGSDQRAIESFGVSPVDGHIVVSAGWVESDVLLAEGIPGIGESLRRKQ
jgi:eukaryotic-like serine/threonine-protein kinase